VTVRLHNCTMMCSLRDEVSQDVSNLQTSKLKPAVQQNSCSLLSPHIHHPSSLPLPRYNSRDGSPSNATSAAQGIHWRACTTQGSHQGNPEVRITLGTVVWIVRLCELSPASLCDQQKITRQSLPAHQVGPCSQHLAVCIVRAPPHTATLLSPTSLLHLPTSGATNCAIS
jgi:hypothetical protein